VNQGLMSVGNVGNLLAKVLCSFSVRIHTGERPFEYEEKSSVAPSVSESSHWMKAS